MRPGVVLTGIAVTAAAFAGATLAMQAPWSAIAVVPPPVLAETPPLPPARGKSLVVIPVDITFAAIRDAVESHAPRDSIGRRDATVAGVVSNAEIGWTVARGPLAVAAQPDALVVSAPLSGTVRATGQLSSQARNNLGGIVGELFGRDAARSVGRLASRSIDQHADVRGNVAVSARIALTPDWRFDPKLTVRLTMADVTMSLAGMRLSVGSEVRPMLERTINDQVAGLQERLRNDPILELAARREWAKLCRSFPLSAARKGLPELWLELRPVRAVAAQPRIGAAAAMLAIGFEAEISVVPEPTRPDCPFPAKLEIVPASEQGRVNIVVPIDVPFAELNRLIEARLAGQTLPEDRSGPFEITIRQAIVAPSADRLLIALKVQARERSGWFGLGTDATVYLWGRPVLDRERQILRLSDVTLDVESEGVLGTAARAALPFLRELVADQSIVDLKPFAATARSTIESALADFRLAGEGIQVDAALADLRLAGVAFDARMVRVIAEAEGTARVTVTRLPAR